MFPPLHTLWNSIYSFTFKHHLCGDRRLQMPCLNPSLTAQCKHRQGFLGLGIWITHKCFFPLKLPASKSPHVYTPLHFCQISIIDACLGLPTACPSSFAHSRALWIHARHKSQLKLSLGSCGSSRRPRKFDDGVKMTICLFFNHFIEV